MKAKVTIIILILIALGLGIGLIMLNQQMTDQQKHDADSIATLSNNVNNVQDKLREQQTVNATLSTNLAQTNAFFTEKLAVSESKLADTADQLKKAQDQVEATAKAAADAKTAADTEVAKRDQKITELQNQNAALDKETVELKQDITNLQARIDDTQKALAASEGDRKFLMEQLKQLQVAKADLEAKFRNLDVLKKQIAMIREDLAVKQRIDWERRGINANFNQKGGERLIHPVAIRPATNAPSLQVDLKSTRNLPVTNLNPGPVLTNPPAK